MFEKWPVQVQDFRQIADHFGGMQGIYPKLRKKKHKDTNMDSKALGSQPIFALKSPPKTLQTTLESHTILGDTITTLIFLYLTCTY